MKHTLIYSCLVVNFEDMGTKWTKAPNLVKLFFSTYIQSDFSAGAIT